MGKCAYDELQTSSCCRVVIKILSMRWGLEGAVCRSLDDKSNRIVSYKCGLVMFGPMKEKKQRCLLGLSEWA